MLLSYIKDHFQRVFEQSDDIIAVISVDQANPGDTTQYRVETFLIAESSKVDFPHLSAFWQLGLVCNNTLSGLALMLCQCFVYAVKQFCINHKTEELVLLDLANRYTGNFNGLALYSQLGFSSFSMWKRNQAIDTIQKEKKFNQVMTLNLESYSLDELRRRIGTNQPPLELNIEYEYAKLVKQIKRLIEKHQNQPNRPDQPDPTSAQLSELLTTLSNYADTNFLPHLARARLYPDESTTYQAIARWQKHFSKVQQKIDKLAATKPHQVDPR